VHVEFVEKPDTMFLISKQARLIHFQVEDVPILSGPGKGVRGLKLVDAGDQVLGGRKLSRPSDALRVVNEHDRELAFGQQKYQVTSRGGKGVKTSQRTAIKHIIPPEIQLVDWDQIDDGPRP
jgi:DNA gyrase subunit A